MTVVGWYRQMDLKLNKSITYNNTLRGDKCFTINIMVKKKG